MTVHKNLHFRDDIDVWVKMYDGMCQEKKEEEESSTLMIVYIHQFKSSKIT